MSGLTASSFCTVSSGMFDLPKRGLLQVAYQTAATKEMNQAALLTAMNRDPAGAFSTAMAHLYRFSEDTASALGAMLADADHRIDEMLAEIDDLICEF